MYKIYKQVIAYGENILRFHKSARIDYHTTNSVSHLMSTIGWKSLQHRRQLSKRVMLYRIINQLVVIPIQPYL